MKKIQTVFDPIKHLEACYGLQPQRIGREGSFSLGFHTAIVLDRHRESVQQVKELTGGYEELAKSITLYSHRGESCELAPHLDRLQKRIHGIALA